MQTFLIKKSRVQKLMLSSLLLALSSASVYASQPSTQFVDASYATMDGGSNGAGIVFNTAMSDRWIVNGEVFYSSDSAMGASLDTATLSLGVDYFMPLNSRTFLQTGPLFLYAQIDYSDSFGGQSWSVSDSETGFGARAVVRHMLSEPLEISAGASLYSFGGSTDTDFSAGARYYFSERLSASAKIYFNEGSSMQFGVGYHF